MHRSLASRPRRKTLALLAALFGATVVAMPVAAWDPTKPVEFVVPAGTGGGADQMARLVMQQEHTPAIERQVVPPQDEEEQQPVAAKRAKDFAVKEARAIPTNSSSPVEPVHDAAGDGVPFNWQDLCP